MLIISLISLLLATAISATSSSITQLEKRQFPGYTITSLGSRTVSGTGVRIQFAIHDGVAVDNGTKTCFGFFTPDAKGHIDEKQQPVSGTTPPGNSP